MPIGRFNQTRRQLGDDQGDAEADRHPDRERDQGADDRAVQRRQRSELVGDGIPFGAGEEPNPNLRKAGHAPCRATSSMPTTASSTNTAKKRVVPANNRSPSVRGRARLKGVPDECGGGTAKSTATAVASGVKVFGLSERAPYGVAALAGAGFAALCADFFPPPSGFPPSGPSPSRTRGPTCPPRPGRRRSARAPRSRRACRPRPSARTPSSSRWWPPPTPASAHSPAPSPRRRPSDSPSRKTQDLPGDVGRLLRLRCSSTNDAPLIGHEPAPGWSVSTT